MDTDVGNYNKRSFWKLYGIVSFRHDGLKTSGQVDLVLCCVDNYEARMTVNIVSTITDAFTVPKFQVTGLNRFRMVLSLESSRFSFVVESQICYVVAITFHQRMHES